MGADGARKRKIAVIAALAAAVLLLALLDKSKYTQDKRVDISKTAGAVRAWLKKAE